MSRVPPMICFRMRVRKTKAVAQTMAAPLQSDGPPQHGRGVKGQFVYWITQSAPTPEVVQQLALRRPAEFSHEEFSSLVVEAHTKCDVEVLETACFKEPDGNGEVHNNLLVRARLQYRWKKVAEKLREERVHVDFSTHVRT